MEAHPQVQRTCDRADAECGRTTALRHRPPDAGKFGVSGNAEPERHRPRGIGEAAEHFRQPAWLRHQCSRRLRADSVRGKYRAFHQQFSPKHKAL